MEKLMLQNVINWHRPRSARGFSLIELMIVVAVVAILSAIAYPSYQEYVRKSRRAQATADLVELAQLAERYHTVQNTYVGFAPPYTTSPRQGTARYNLQVVNPTQGSYSITAAPTSTGGQTADKCGTLSINQANVKASSRGTVADCW
jgi:type IV pilus assembly protein PilE